MQRASKGVKGSCRTELKSRRKSLAMQQREFIEIYAGHWMQRPVERIFFLEDEQHTKSDEDVLTLEVGSWSWLWRGLRGKHTREYIHTDGRTYTELHTFQMLPENNNGSSLIPTNHACSVLICSNIQYVAENEWYRGDAKIYGLCATVDAVQTKAPTTCYVNTILGGFMPYIHKMQFAEGYAGYTLISCFNLAALPELSQLRTLPQRDGDFMSLRVPRNTRQQLLQLRMIEGGDEGGGDGGDEGGRSGRSGRSSRESDDYVLRMPVDMNDPRSSGHEVYWNTLAFIDTFFAEVANIAPDQQLVQETPLFSNIQIVHGNVPRVCIFQATLR